MKRISVLLATSTVLAAPIAIAFQTPAFAACTVFARTPSLNSTYNNVIGVGGRDGCGTAKQILVEIKYNQIAYPDKVLAYKSGTYTNVTLRPQGKCREGSQEYYTEVGGAAGHAESSRRRISGPNC